MKKLTLTKQILLSMVIGVIIGMIFNTFPEESFVRATLIEGPFRVVGEIFIASLKMLVVPLVFISLVCGSSAIGDPKKLGRVGIKTLGLYMLTTAVAITIALFFAKIINPGVGFDIASSTPDFVGSKAPPLSDILINIFPSNPIKSMVEGNMLQVIVFSLLIGVALSALGKKAEQVRNLFLQLNELVMKMVMMMMKLAPWGVFCLLATVFTKQGISAIKPLASYFFVVVLVLVIHGTIIYGSLLAFLARLNPVTFFKKMRPVFLFAFSTSSSNASLPVTLKTVEEDLGVDNSIASFTIPLGATVNMDGTAIMQGVATVFIANAYNQALTTSDLLQVILTATLASVGTAGVPGVGLITLAMVLQQVGLPVEGIALIIGVDRLLDMMRTAVNVSGDASVSCIVAKSEKLLDTTMYNSPVNKIYTD